MMNLSGKDNSMDAYSATAREALLLEMPENALDGGMKRSILGATGAYCFKKHLLGTAAESWDEVIFAGTEGKADSKRYDFEDQLWDIGPVAGTDHYVALSVEIQEDGEYRSFLTERDENHEYLREVPLDFLNGSETGGGCREPFWLCGGPVRGGQPGTWRAVPSYVTGGGYFGGIQPRGRLCQ